MTKPTWQDFGTHDESIVPELWDGVVGAWAPCLGPTGSRLHDHSRRTNWGTLTNMDNATDWIVDGGQYALDLDGSNDHVPCGSALNPLLGGQITISAWVSFRAYSSTQAIVSNVTGGGGGGSFQLEFGRAANKLGWISNASGFGIDLTSTATIADSKWRHIVGVRGGATGAWIITLGINGIFNSGTSAVNPSSTLGNVTIGRAGDFNGAYLNAIISDMTIWNHPLSVDELLHLYQLGPGGMYQRRRRSRIYIPQAGFQAAWARRQNQIIGGGL